MENGTSFLDTGYFISTISYRPGPGSSETVGVNLLLPQMNGRGFTLGHILQTSQELTQ